MAELTVRPKSFGTLGIYVDSVRNAPIFDPEQLSMAVDEASQKVVFVYFDAEFYDEIVPMIDEKGFKYFAYGGETSQHIYWRVKQCNCETLPSRASENVN